jgi:hypothetical protein
MASQKKTSASGAPKRRRPAPPISVHEPTDAYEGGLIPRTRLIAALVNEIARSRVRHRALLDLLEKNGTIEMRRYIEQYKSVEEHDFVAFVELLLLSPSEFQTKNAEWLAANTQRFGYDGSSRQHVQLSDHLPAPQRQLKNVGEQGAAVPRGKSKSRRPEVGKK